MEKRKILKGFCLIAVLLLGAAFFMLSACSRRTAVVTEKKSEKGYSLPQIMIIAMAEKNNYEDVCTKQIWDVQVPESENRFSDYLLTQIKDFMEEMKIMNLLAQEKQVSLTPEEKARMVEAAEEYFENLNKEDISYMGVTIDDVRTVFEDYCIANKLVEELTREVNLEVSDSEAKVITIMQVHTSDKAKMELFVQSLSEENADFQKKAEELGLSVERKQLGREETSQEFENTAFSLCAGQDSSIIESQGSYYVLKCLSDYDKEATMARKDVIFQERKKKAFCEIYDEFKAGIALSYSEDPWKKLDLEKKGYAENADFFKIYKEHMR